jgi:hypothetical protein
MRNSIDAMANNNGHPRHMKIAAGREGAIYDIFMSSLEPSVWDGNCEGAYYRNM